MWYFTWILGLGAALAFGIINVMWLEVSYTFGELDESRIPRLARRGLQAPSPNAQIAERSQEEWSTKLPGKLSHPLRVPRGPLAQAMVHVSDRAADTDLGRGCGQGDRIGPAGARHQHRNVHWETGVNGKFDALRQISHCPSVAPRDTDFGYGLASRLLRTQFSG